MSISQLLRRSFLVSLSLVVCFGAISAGEASAAPTATTTLGAAPTPPDTYRQVYNSLTGVPQGHTVTCWRYQNMGNGTFELKSVSGMSETFVTMYGYRIFTGYYDNETVVTGTGSYQNRFFDNGIQVATTNYTP